MRRGLQASAAVVALVLVGLTIHLLMPVLAGSARKALAHDKVQVPAFAYEPWHALAVQDGRTKPFQTACAEAVQQITGRSRFEGLDPVAIVLAWMLDEGVAWESSAFILCDYHELRRHVLEHLPDEQKRLLGETGKYLSPAVLRSSPGFDRLLGEMSRKRKELQARAHLELSNEHLKAEEVGRRLLLFDTLCGKSATRLCHNALIGNAYIDLREHAEILDCSPEEALAALERKQEKRSDPFHLVGLDRVPGSGWFSLADLRALQRDPELWQATLARRLRASPQAYLSADGGKEFQTLCERSSAGKSQESIAEVKKALQERRVELLHRLEEADRSGDRELAGRLFYQLVSSPQHQRRFQQARTRLGGGNLTPALIEELRGIVEQADAAVVDRLAKGLDLARARLDDAAARMVHLDCLEKLHPDLYREALAAQPLPRAQVDAVLASFGRVRTAYQSGKADAFDEASRTFFKLLADTTDNAATRGDSAPVEGYPGVTTIPLELQFNRWRPFLWAWIIMLVSVVVLGLSLAFNQRAGYRIGMTIYFASLVVQTVGFGMRMALSAAAPVSNMYESVIFTAYMAAPFALLLEAIYRRGSIALAGAAVATLGLLLADQLPLALDPKISPMVPVLRTNYWLTVHVLTIVSSYAAGTLAWGLGNVTLALLVFRRADDDATLKMLAHHTYRALQIAVLLLAAGTFLGGWWAAESWGRFWGWDPKEVGALIALVCYVIPLHARYLGWVRDFGLAVAAILCYASILLSWYVVNFLVAAGLHSYGFGAGGGAWVLWACLLNIEWVLLASIWRQARAGKPNFVSQ